MKPLDVKRVSKSIGKKEKIKAIGKATDQLSDWIERAEAMEEVLDNIDDVPRSQFPQVLKAELKMRKHIMAAHNSILMALAIAEDIFEAFDLADAIAAAKELK